MVFYKILPVFFHVFPLKNPDVTVDIPFGEAPDRRAPTDQGGQLTLGPFSWMYFVLCYSAAEFNYRKDIFLRVSLYTNKGG